MSDDLSESYLKYLHQPVLHEMLFHLNVNDILRFCETYGEQICSDDFWLAYLKRRYPSFYRNLRNNDPKFSYVDIAKVAERRLTGIYIWTIRFSGRSSDSEQPISVYYQVGDVSLNYVRGAVEAYSKVLEFEFGRDKFMQVLFPTGDFIDSRYINITSGQSDDYHSYEYRDIERLMSGRAPPLFGIMFADVMVFGNQRVVFSASYTRSNHGFLNGLRNVLEYFGFRVEMKTGISKMGGLRRGMLELDLE